MTNRIQEILNRYNLTAAKLADQLEVPRSTISHILTGRNKPSLEFIQKLLHSFPDINTDWLLKGDGAMNRLQHDLFSNLENVDIKDREKTEDDDTVQKKYPSENPPEPPKANADGNDVNLRRVKDESVTPGLSENHYFNDEKKAEIKRKKIIRIITFYTDNTFDEFFPSNLQD